MLLQSFNDFSDVILILCYKRFELRGIQSISLWLCTDQRTASWIPLLGMTDLNLLHSFLLNRNKIHFPTLRWFFISCSENSWLLIFHSTSSVSARTSTGKSLKLGAMNRPLNKVPRKEIGFVWSRPQESFLLHKYAQTAEPIVVCFDSLYALNYWNCVLLFTIRAT